MIFSAVLFGMNEYDYQLEHRHSVVIYKDEITCLPIPHEVTSLYVVTLFIPSNADIHLRQLCNAYETNMTIYDHPVDVNTLETISILVDIRGYKSHLDKWDILLEWNASSTNESIEYLHKFDLYDYNVSYYDELQLTLNTDFEEPISVGISPIGLPPVARYRVLFGAIILLFMYICIITEVIHRCFAAGVAAALSIGILSSCKAKPSFGEVISWVDFQTVGLLLGMMIIVGFFASSGFFEYAAVKTYKLSRGNLWVMNVLLSTFTMLLAAFLDNVTGILLVVPITLKLCRVLDMDPRVLILCEIIFSNIGGGTTIIGDPPTIIIANNKDVIAAGMNFVSFGMHVTLPILISTFVVWFWVWYQYHDMLKRDPSLKIYEEVQVWKRTLASLDPNVSSTQEIRQHVVNYLQTLESRISPDCELARLNEPVTVPTIEELEEMYRVTDRPLFICSSVLLSLVVLLFFIHDTAIGIKMGLAQIALFGAAFHILLVIVIKGKINLKVVFEKVEWETLAFFSLLFILMEAISKLGLTAWIGSNLVFVISAAPPGVGRLIVAELLILWVSAIASALIDNIPYTVTLVSIVVQLSRDLRLPLLPLIWSLVFGTALGGNATIIASGGNLVGIGFAHTAGYKISFIDFMRFGSPIVVITLSLSSLWLIFFHALIPWY